MKFALTRGEEVGVEHCAAGTEALKGLLETEYAFSEQAHISIRAAFLQYLAADSLVLQPAPTPGRAFYAAQTDDSNGLEWYPAMADLAGSTDLGFTSGPWVYRGASGAQSHGHFLTIWKRDPACQWRVQFDGGVSHGAPAAPELKLKPDQAVYTSRDAPASRLISENAAAQTISAFQNIVRENDLSAGFRTYARTGDFKFFTDGAAPMDLAAANRYVTAQAILGDWKEDADGRSSDSSLTYAVGVVSDAKQRNRYAYMQLWQYEPRVANYGLRLLLLNPLAPSKSK
jgi:hypothetical protein